MLDLDAPIVPGYPAAGLTIGAPASGVTEAPKGATALPNGALRLDYDSVSIWVHGEKIVRICLRERYRGGRWPVP